MAGHAAEDTQSAKSQWLARHMPDQAKRQGDVRDGLGMYPARVYSSSDGSFQKIRRHFLLKIVAIFFPGVMCDIGTKTYRVNCICR